MNNDANIDYFKTAWQVSESVTSSGPDRPRALSCSGRLYKTWQIPTDSKLPQESNKVTAGPDTMTSESGLPPTCRVAPSLSVSQFPINQERCTVTDVRQLGKCECCENYIIRHWIRFIRQTRKRYWPNQSGNSQVGSSLCYIFIMRIYASQLASLEFHLPQGKGT